MYPSNLDYDTAVNHLDRFVLDPMFKGGIPRRIKGSQLELYSGGYSRVFPVIVSNTTYALRCWIADVGNAAYRYQEIENYLKCNPLPYFVEFAYVEEGILVKGKKYPIIRMEWVDGATLKDFIVQNNASTNLLLAIADKFKKMVKDLRDKNISHGDLQDGNIIIHNNGSSIEIKLIDYDSLFVPNLHGMPDQIVGLPAYQHPKRIATPGMASKKVDYFSELVIYLSLKSLAERPDLWVKYNIQKADGLLFSPRDFKDPSKSNIFRELKNLSPEIRYLSSTLQDFCNQPSIENLLPLEEFLGKSSLLSGTVKNVEAVFSNQPSSHKPSSTTLPNQNIASISNVPTQKGEGQSQPKLSGSTRGGKPKSVGKQLIDIMESQNQPSQVSSQQQTQVNFSKENLLMNTGVRLSKGFYLSSFISGGAMGIIASIIWIINVFTEKDDILFIISLGTGIIPSIYGITIFCVFWYKVWVSIQDGHARTTPGKAIGFMFIPFFNGYWLFQSIWGFAKDYNTYIQRHGLNNPKLPDGLFLAYCILGCCSVLPAVGMAVSIAALVIYAIIINKVCDVINNLTNTSQGVKNYGINNLQNASQGEKNLRNLFR